MKKFIGHISFWGAVVGAILLALNLPISGWGYIPFTMSNLASLHLLRESNGPKPISYQLIFFIIINLIGIYCWLI